MSYRITTIAGPTQTIIKIDGRIGSEESDQLLRMFDEIMGPTALDLTELQSVDRAGVIVLRELIAQGVELRSASPYVELLLKTEPGCRGRASGDTP